MCSWYKKKNSAIDNVSGNVMYELIMPRDFLWIDMHSKYLSFQIDT